MYMHGLMPDHPTAIKIAAGECSCSGFGFPRVFSAPGAPQCLSRAALAWVGGWVGGIQLAFWMPPRVLALTHSPLLAALQPVVLT
jgi:hypothetical protein